MLLCFLMRISFSIFKTCRLPVVLLRELAELKHSSMYVIGKDTKPQISCCFKSAISERKNKIKEQFD